MIHRDFVVFLFNTGSGFVFAILTLIYSQIWPVLRLFLVIEIGVPIVTVYLERRQIQKENKKSKKRPKILPEHTAYLVSVAIILNYLPLLFGNEDAIFLSLSISILWQADIFNELGQTLARASIRRETASILSNTEDENTSEN